MRVGHLPLRCSTYVLAMRERRHHWEGDKTMRNTSRCAAVAALCTLAPVAHAGTVYTFGESCTNNLPGDVLIGLAQLSFEVSANGSNVDFTFNNVGANACSITDLYWDDSGATIASLFSITNGPGTSFSAGASPGNLPGGNNCTPPFVSSVGLSADSDPPTEPNGVNPTEFVTITFGLSGSMTFADVLADLDSGAMRVGIHVQGFKSGGSEGFVNAVPAPSGLALIGLASLARRRRR